MTEAEMQAALIEAARLGGWLIHHDRPARTHSGWRTAVSGDVGFPDLIVARDKVLLALELKASEKPKLGPGQAEWLHELQGARVLAQVVTPVNYEPMLKVLVRKPQQGIT